MFTQVYKHQRVLRDKHCGYTIYNCQICDDLLPTALALEKILIDDKDAKEQLDIVQG